MAAVLGWLMICFRLPTRHSTWQYCHLNPHSEHWISPCFWSSFHHVEAPVCHSPFSLRLSSPLYLLSLSRPHPLSSLSHFPSHSLCSLPTLRLVLPLSISAAMYWNIKSNATTSIDENHHMAQWNKHHMVIHMTATLTTIPHHNKRMHAAAYKYITNRLSDGAGEGRFTLGTKEVLRGVP